MPRKIFVAGEILTAADVNTNLMDQSVMVFDDASARTTAIPTPVEGMVTYLKDTDRLEQFDGTNFVVAAPPQTGVLQVVQTVKTNAFATASTSYVDVTDFTATITPSSDTSKILVIADVKYSGSDNPSTAFGRLVRGTTAIYVSANDVTGHVNRNEIKDGDVTASTNVFLDNPATAASVTYKWQIRSSANTIRFNSGRNAVTTVSSITLMEVAG